jgi:cytoskeletal protein CcmA (bactofilin family)
MSGAGEDRIAEAPTVIDAGASFEGLLTFRGSARIDGVLSGRVIADGCLVIGPRGRVTATVEVDELVVAGEFEGDAQARTRVQMLASGRVSGRLRAPSFSLAEGCVFDGQWETVVPRVPTAPEADEERASGGLEGPVAGASAP